MPLEGLGKLKTPEEAVKLKCERNLVARTLALLQGAGAFGYVSVILYKIDVLCTSNAKQVQK
jgi:hypothetical protein